MKEKKEISVKPNPEDFYKVIASLEKAKDLKAFFIDLCTPAELQAMVDRWCVVKLLNEKVSYRKINEMTGVSTTTITRVARSLEYGEGGYKKAIQKTIGRKNG